MITLERAYLPDRSATLGRLIIDDTELYTLEPPWRDNEPCVSCIPEGTYPLQLRDSPIVQRTSRGVYPEGWEITEVPNRTFIMFHVGNWVRDTEGCVLVGENFTWHWKNGPTVANSVAGFNRFMEALSQRGFWDIEIRNISAC